MIIVLLLAILQICVGQITTVLVTPLTYRLTESSFHIFISAQSSSNLNSTLTQCFVHWGKVNALGKNSPWQEMTPVPSVFQGTFGSEGKNLTFAALMQPDDGLYEYTAYCLYNTTNGVSKVWRNSQLNGQLEAIRYSINAAEWVFTDDPIRVDYSMIDPETKDLIAIMNFTEVNSKCPSFNQDGLILSIPAPNKTGTVDLSAPNAAITVTVAIYEWYGNNTLGAVQCGDDYYKVLTSRTVKIYSSQAKQVPSGGRAMHITTESLFEGELQLVRDIRQTDVPSNYRDANAFSWAECLPGNALGAQEFTLEAWYKVPQSTLCCSTIFYARNWFQVQIVDKGKLRLDMFFAAGGCNYFAIVETVQLDDNLWHHYAISINAKTTSILIDGKNLFTFSAGCSSFMYTKYYSLGRTERFPNDKVEKWVDEFRFWTKVRTIEEIKKSMYRPLRSHEIQDPDLYVYYDFDTRDAEFNQWWKVQNRAGIDNVLTLGQKDIGSSGDDTVILRNAPSLVQSDAPITNGPLYFAFKKPFNITGDMWFPFEIPLNDGLINFFDLPQGKQTCLLAREDRTTISGSTHQSSNNKFRLYVPLNVNQQLVTFKYSFTDSQLLTSATNYIYIDVRRELPPYPGGPGGALFCDGKSFGFAKDFVLPTSPGISRSIPYTVEWWSFNYYSPVNERLGAVYSMGNNEVVDNWCGNGRHCKGRMTTFLGDPYMDVYSGWNPSNEHGHISTDPSKEWGSWTHYAITSQGFGKDIKIFVNGDELGKTIEEGATAELYGLYLCHWPYYDPNVHIFVGAIDEFRIWNYARSWEQLINNMGHQVPGDSDGLLVYYDFNGEPEGSSIVTDRSPNGYHLAFGACAPATDNFCFKNTTVYACNKDEVPKRPCYVSDGQTEDPIRKPKLIQSSAPVGGYFPDFRDINPGKIVSINLPSVSRNYNSILTKITTIPSFGKLINPLNQEIITKEQILNTTQVQFIPEIDGGGDPYVTFEYTVKDRTTESPVIRRVSISILCPNATYLNDETKKCMPCPIGTYSSVLSYSTQCTPCPTNYYQDQPGQTQCFKCPIRSKQPLEGQSNCIPCSLSEPESEQCPTIEYYPWSSSGGNILLILTIIMMAICTAVGVIIYIYKDTPIIKASSPLFCLLIIFGMLVGYSNNFLFIGEPNMASCGLRPWLAATALSLILGNLLAKTWRIYKIFGKRMPSDRSTLIGNKSLLGFSGSLVLLELLIPAIWTGVDKLEPFEGTCRSKNSSFEWSMIGIMAALNFALVVYGAFLAFQTRKVHSAYKESTYIGFSIYNILICGAVILPVVFIPSAGFQIIYYLRGLGIIFCTTFIMMSMFGPKIYIILFQKEKNTLAYMKTFRPSNLNSFQTPEEAKLSTVNENELSHGMIHGNIQVMEDSDSFTSLIFKKKFVGKEVFVVQQQKLIGFKDLNNNHKSTSALYSLNKAVVSALEQGTEYLLFVSHEDWNLTLKFTERDQYINWAQTLKTICQFRRLAKDESSNVTSSKMKLSDLSQVPDDVEMDHK